MINKYLTKLSVPSLIVIKRNLSSFLSNHFTLPSLMWNIFNAPTTPRHVSRNFFSHKLFFHVLFDFRTFEMCGCYLFIIFYLLYNKRCHYLHQLNLSQTFSLLQIFFKILFKGKFLITNTP